MFSTAVDKKSENSEKKGIERLRVSKNRVTLQMNISVGTRWLLFNLDFMIQRSRQIWILIFN